MRNSSDESLLFAILALQLKFIEPHQLLDAGNAWFETKKIPIGQIMVEKKFIRESDLSLLEQLVSRRIDNAGSIEGSLQGIANDVPGGAIDFQQLSGYTDLNMPAEWQNRIDQFGSTTMQMPLPSKGGTDSVGRFRVVRDLARGGLGKVSVAKDDELDREVAIKEILQQFSKSVDARIRFVAEARVTGSLEHPGIVPIYSMGTFTDGRPYYAMRLIRGKSLADRLKELDSQAAKGNARKSLGSNAEAKRKAIRPLINHLIAACNTVAYANNRGVLHRDIKPSNIMLGKYGETIMVDWGLAKAFGSISHNPLHSEPPIADVVESGSQPTAYGSVMGTPSFMSPEQANGLLESVDQRSDVFSLGATLYAILVGSAPYEGSDRAEILSRAKNCQFKPPRDVYAWIPKEINAVCLKAMAKNPEDRYPTATDLAEDLERFIAGESVTALPESLPMRVLRWSKRYQGALLGGLLLVSTSLAGMAWLYQQVLQERNVAQIQYKRAENSVGTTALVMQNLISKIADDKWSQTPELDLARLEVLTTARIQAEQLLASNPEDDQVRQLAIDVMFRSASVDEHFGELDRAYETVLRSQAELHVVPDDKRTRYPWGALELDILSIRNRMERSRNGVAQAYHFHRIAMEVGKKYFEAQSRGPHELSASIGYGRALYEYAQFEFDRLEFEAAKIYVTQAVEALDPMRAGSLRDFGVRVIRMQSELLRIRIALEQEELAEAAKQIAIAREILAELDSIQQTDRENRIFEATLTYLTGRLAGANKDVVAAIKAFDTADAALDEDRDASNRGAYPLRLAEIQAERVRMLSQCDRREDAQQALKAFERRMASIETGGNQSYALLMVQWYVARARLEFARTGDSEDAQTQATQELERLRNKLRSWQGTHSQQNEPPKN